MTSYGVDESVLSGVRGAQITIKPEQLASYIGAPLSIFARNKRVLWHQIG